jgi:hypothetical protein
MSLPNEVNLHHLGSTGYNIARSVRLRSSASAYLNRTPASTGSRQTFTWSGWVKRGTLGARLAIFNSGDTASPQNGIQLIFFGDNTLYVSATGGTTLVLQTSAVYRDPSAWYHIVFAVDTTQATASNRAKLYVNGSQVTAFSSTTYPSQNQNFDINNSSNQMKIGASNDTGSTVYYFDGYITEVNFIDGQQLTPSSFGSTNAITGVWQPAKYTGTYGTNGFYLKFSDNSTAAALGTDFSGNSNTWTVNNISVTAGTTYDSMTDVPTLTSATAANYAVYNPLAKGSVVTISDGNLKYSSNGASGTNGLISMYISSGMKIYFEVTCGAAALYRNVDFGTAGVTYTGDGGVISGGTGGSGTFATWTTGDVIAFACDYTAGTIACYKNNTLQTTITGATNTSPWSINPSQAVGLGEFYFNAGQRPFAYTPPSGFVGLNTYNLPDSTVKNGGLYMKPVTYTGTGTNSTSITGVGFQTDFNWTKSRSSGSYSHQISDVVRGFSYYLYSNATTAEGNDPTNHIQSVNSDGYVTNSGASFNASGVTYVSWNWKAGTTSATNNNGSITSQVSVGATQGFSIVTYTGTGSNATVGHGLGVAPSMIIVKSRSLATSWPVYHISLTSASYRVFLDLTNAQASDSVWNSTAPTSSVFSIGPTGYSVNNSSATYVAYCFASVVGYSAFGSYLGNGSADGPFVFLGFRPRFVLWKRITTAGGHWGIIDSGRNTYNLANLSILADASDGDATDVQVLDLVSNGFKIRTSDGGQNLNADTFIYAAFAENPFKNSLAR